MSKFFMDLDNEDIGFADGDIGYNSAGDPLIRVGGNMFTNMNTGEVHFADSWDEPEDDLFGDDLDF